MRYTEYHAGVAVIKDRSLLKDAMAKLARLEDMSDVPALICDQYCRFPKESKSEDELIDKHCMECMLGGVFAELTEEER